jgi:DNA mismatch repair protein MutS2
MDDRSLRALEFYHLLEILKAFSVSPLGRKRCEALRPYKELPLIQSRLTEVIELKEILQNIGDLPIRELKDIEDILRRLEVEGSVLSVQEIIDIYKQMALCKGLRRFFHRLEKSKAPHLQEKVSKLSSLKNLGKEILQAINLKGEILDRASPTLSEIRHRLKTVREKAKGVLEYLLHQEELQPIFQEQVITLRNGRYVLLIKSDSKHRLEGIIHDQSQSRMTFFFEPIQAVPFNNEMNILTGEEKEEEYRILADLSNKLRGEMQSLWADFEMLGEWDLLYAMAKLSIRLMGVQPVLNEEGKMEMKEARHPLLTLQKGDQVVPIHLRMGDGIRGLIISGANAGGKTVALKTLGLLTLMVQSGLPIPVAEGSQVAVFQDIFAVIGDEQNIEENLSTFSSHLLHVNQIIEKAGPHSLILLDELGVGTHASEGCALAMGFLDRFRETGALVIVTTHFDRLKAYGYLHSDVENVAVEFDEETLEPKYTLSYGSSGVSNAFLVAEKLGVSEKVLQTAKQYQDGGDQGVAQALEGLERLKADTEKERLQVIRIKEEVERERQRLRELLDGIKKRRHEIFVQAEEKAKKAAQEVEGELKEWVRQKKEEKAFLSSSRLKIDRREIQAMREKYFPPIPIGGSHRIPVGLKIGDRVRILSLRSDGILAKMEGPLKRAEVMTEKGKVETSLSDIVRMRDEEEKKEIEIPKTHILPKGEAQEPPPQLNVIGLTVEDALPKVDKFIDQAIVYGLEKVMIVHGIGSGRLRNAIGKYLNSHRGVKGIAPGDVMRGGSGVTIVELR